MRIAFASCLFTRVFSQQPVWDWIGQQRPDHLVLLGDSVYLDLKGPQDPRDMDDTAFAPAAPRWPATLDMNATGTG